MKNTCQKGNIIEAKILSRFVEKDYLTFIPFGEGHKCDLVFISKEGDLKRVQVKKSRETKSGSFTINLYSNGGGYNKIKYTKSDIDYFGTEHGGRYYLIPIEDVEGKTVVSIRPGSKYEF